MVVCPRNIFGAGHTTLLAKYKKPSPFHYSVIVLGEIDHTHQATRSASHWSPSLQFTPQWMHKLIVGWMKLGSESRRIVPHLLHTLLPIFKNFWESIIGVNPQPHVYVQCVAFFRLDASITMLNTKGCLLLQTHHLLSPSRDVYSGLTTGLVRYDQGGMRKIPCLGWAKWKLGRAPCPRGTRTWACGRRVSKPPPPPYTRSLQGWRSPPTSM